MFIQKLPFQVSKNKPWERLGFQGLWKRKEESKKLRA